MSASATGTDRIPGLGLPADPVTGLPLSADGAAEFWRWAACMLGGAALTATLFFGLRTGFSPGGGAASAGSGQTLYAQTCAACHGQQAQGVTGLGKDLVTSAFVTGQTDAQLVAFIKAGRAADDPANTTKIPMPPNGGNPSLSEADLQAIVGHLRTLKR